MGNSPIVIVLIANHSLKNYGGTESYVYAMIEELVKKRIYVEYFTFEKGIISDLIEKDFGVKFMSKKKYSYIFANHNTCVAHLFNRGFIIQTCHGIFPKLEQPSIFADKHISISLEVMDHLFLKGFKSQLITNGINCNRFTSKKNINKNLKTVLSLCHGEKANNLIEEVCCELAVSFIKQSKFTNGIWNIETLINEADLVIGIGRSAMEGMACGRPVLIYDSRLYMDSVGDGYIFNTIDDSKKFNFSGRCKNINYDKILLKNEIKKYNYCHGNFFSNYIRNNYDIKDKIDEYLNLKKSMYFSKNPFFTTIQVLKKIFGLKITFITIQALKGLIKLKGLL